MIPPTNYADSNGAEIAYKVVGEGPRDFVICMPGPTHLDMLFEIPEYVDLLERLGRLGRVIAFDKRGTGLSDRRPDSVTPRQRCEDLIAVMDAAASPSAVLMGWMDSAVISLLTAAVFPDRVSAVIAGEALAVGHRDADHPYGVNRTVLRLMMAAIEHGAWGRALLVPIIRPRLLLSPQQLADYARYESMGATPRVAAQIFRESTELDLRPHLDDIKAPVLLLHEKGFRVVPGKGVRWLADRLPKATVRLLGSDSKHRGAIPLHDIVEEVEEFLVGTRTAQDSREVLSLLFTDVVGSTQAAAAMGDASWKLLIVAHRASVRKSVARYGGREIDTAGDGFLASFTLPSAALRCARQTIGEAREQGLEIRAGIHTGEVLVLPTGGLVGIGVHIAARVAAMAGPSEVLMTDTVRLLVEGSGTRTEEVGERVLKGVPGRWTIFRLIQS